MSLPARSPMLGDFPEPYEGRLFRALPDRLQAMPAVSQLFRSAHTWKVDRKTARVVPALPEHDLVSLDASPDVLLARSRSPWHFSPQTLAQESAFAHEMVSRGRSLAVTDQASRLSGKSVMLFLPGHLIAPALWDYSRQAQEFVAGLERQGNEVFCSSHEVAFWENKVHMHRRLDEIGAPTPHTRILTEESWRSTSFDIEPVLIKQEHSAGSAGIHHFVTAEKARSFVAGYSFRSGESLIMQEVVAGATRDLRLTMVGERVVPSATYWRTKSPEALASTQWTTTATSNESHVEHAEPPASVTVFAARLLRNLGLRTAGIDLMWVDDDLLRDPLVLELSPYYQPNPPKPVPYANVSYKKFKSDVFASDGYLAGQYAAFRDIAVAILDQRLF